MRGRDRIRRQPDPRLSIPPAFATQDDFLYSLCLDGIREQYGEISEGLKRRLDYEFEVIRSKGFVAYFLIVWDYVNYARSKGMRCVARGSAAGSLVAYVLGITNVDPIRYDLLFERFLNPERMSMPDIDMDFPDDRREEVIRYVADKYGWDRVGQVVTFGHARRESRRPRCGPRARACKPRPTVSPASFPMPPPHHAPATLSSKSSEMKEERTTRTRGLRQAP